MQRRLAGLKLDTGEDEGGEYGPATEAAIRAFQVRRGLRVDGVCGRQTWAALVEAGYRLGDRLLYHRERLLRGDDVSSLQRLLGAMGFDAGRVDGLFGERTAAALADFQRNAGLVVDAICGPATLDALRRVSGRAAEGSTVSGIREVERLRGGPPGLHGRKVVVGEQGGLDALSSALGHELNLAGAAVVLVHHPDGSELADLANRSGADVYVGLALDAESEGPWTAFYSHPNGWTSPGGKRLAELVQAVVPGVVGAKDLGIRGMSTPVLLETRMPAVVCELAPPAAVVASTGTMAAELAGAIERWATGCA